MFKDCTVELISHASEVMLKILQHYVNWELPAVQAGFQRGRETRDQIVNIHWIMEKAREFQKNICFTDYATAFDSVDHNKLWKILKRWEYQTTLSVSWETCMQVKKEQLEPDMEQRTGSKFGKEYDKAAYCHPAYLTFMQSTSCEMPGWMKHRLAVFSQNQHCREKYQQPQACRWYHSNGRKRRETKRLLMRVKEESEKAGFKLNIETN